MKNRINKRRDILQLLIGLAILLLINYVGSFVFKRLDLTSEKRYSLSEPSREMAKNLEDIVYVRVYLDGQLPAGFKRLRDATKEMLDEFRAYAGDHVQYEFINPSESPHEKTRLGIYQELSKQGLQYTNLEFREKDQFSEKIIFPGAIFSYRGQEIPLQLLKSQMGADPEVMLNNSEQQLEYEIASTIRKLTRYQPPKIAFIEGHNELDEFEVADITKSLKSFYTVDRVAINGKLDALKGYKAIIIAKPDSAFSEKDKFIIDQFIMKGGKSLWLIEPIRITMDSLITQNTTMAFPFSVNLEDQLFKYGVRINPDLVMDLQALPIPIVTGYIGNQPKQEFFPWFYFPLLMSEAKHPVVNNLDAVKTEFASSIDTLARKNVKKTILLNSSRYTKMVNTPTRVSLNVLRDPPDERQYTKSPQAVAVLLEGEFESVFTNRIPPVIAENEDIGFRESSHSTKMIVISDGDIIKNNVNRERNQYFALGYDRYTKRQYGNKDFIMNAVNYLCDDSGLIAARGKDFKLRLLDPKRIQDERMKWQTLNMTVPILLVLLFGIAQYFIRKRKYKV